MRSCIPSCFTFKSTSATRYAASAVTPGAEPPEPSLEGVTTQTSPEPLHVHHLPARYDRSRLGVLVLACGPDWTPSTGNLPSTDNVTAIYNNHSADAIFEVSSTQGVHGCDAAANILDALQRSEPALVVDLCAHLIRFATADPVGRLDLHLPSQKYCAPSSRGTDGSTEGPAEGTAVKAPRRRWLHAVVEPVLLSDSPGAGDDRECAPPQPILGRSKPWQPASCQPGANRADLRAQKVTLPAIVVTFHPISFKHALSYCTAAPSKEEVLSIGACAKLAPHDMNPVTCHSSQAEEPIAFMVDDSCGRQSQLQPDPNKSSCARGRTPTLSSGRPDPAPARSPNSKNTATECTRAREGMVLAGLTTLVTAFTADGRTVLYQNAPSVSYFGERPQCCLPETAVGGTLPGAAPKQMAEDIADSILGELFVLEPNKLSRMLKNVCLEGRVWKGIVQVPASCTLATTTPSLGSRRCAPAAQLSEAAASGGGMRVTTPAACRLVLAAAAQQAQGPGPSPSMVAAAGESLLGQSLGCVPKVFGTLDSVLNTVTPMGGHSIQHMGGHSIQHTVFTVGAHGAPTVNTGGSEKLTSLDADALSTSIWGLLMDIPDQPAAQETASGRAPTIEEIRAQSSSVSRATVSAAAQRAYASRRSLFTASTTDGGQIPGARIARGATFRMLPAPRVPSGTPNRAGGGDATASTGGSGAVRPDGPIRYEGLISNSSTVISKPLHGPGSDSLGGRSGAESFASMVMSRQLQGGCRHEPPRRCITRTDICGSRSPPPLISRMFAFASSLRNTPSVVQQALQQAVSGSIGSIGGGLVGTASSTTSLEYSKARTALASEVSLSMQSPMSAPSPCRDDVNDKQDDDIDVNTSSKLAEAGQAFRPLPCGGRKPPNFLRLSQASSEPKPRIPLTTLLPASTVESWNKSWNANSQRRKDEALPQAPGGNPPATEPGQPMPVRQCNGLASDVLNAKSGSLAIAVPDRPSGAALAASTLALRSDGIVSGRTLQGGIPVTGSRCGAGTVLRMKPDASVKPPGDLLDMTMPPSSADSTKGVETRRLLNAVHSACYCWHEVSATRTVDPVTGQHVILVTQVDVTTKVEAERHLAFVTEAEHQLLEQIFPRHVLAYMTEEGGPWAAQTRGDAHGGKAVVRDINKLATSHAEVTLLFADIQGFTPMCEVLEPRVVMAFLNDLFTQFDQRLDEFGVYKVETIGDCYFVAGGLIHEDEHGMSAVRALDSHADPLHAQRVFMFAKALLAAASEVTLPTTGGPVRLRVGIHSGPVVSGVVGQRMPRFCLFGDTVNTASRMEHTGVPGCIHASEAAKQLLPNEPWVPTGGIEVKGKGIMNTYLWAPPDQELRAALSRYTATKPYSANRSSPQPSHQGDTRGSSAVAGSGGGTGRAIGRSMQASSTEKPSSSGDAYSLTQLLLGNES